MLRFLKGTLDWTDGLIARIKNQTSPIGHILDTWGSHIGEISLITSIGIYCYNFTDNNNLYPHYRAIVKTESKKESSEIVDKKLVGNVSSESNHTAHHIILFFSLILSLVCVIITYLV